MRLSQQFGRTLRDAPTEANLISHCLIARAGLARSPASGTWCYLPPGWRVIRRLESLLRAELEALGGQQIHLPVGANSIAVVSELCRHEVESYRDLPRVLYRVQSVTHDDPHRYGGLLRLRQSVQVEAFSLHADVTGLDAIYAEVVQAVARVLDRCGLPAVSVEALPVVSGLQEGIAHVFALPHPQGEMSIVRCMSCEYAASVEAATFRRDDAPAGEPLPLEKVATPDCKTIADLCAFLNIAPRQTLKAVFYTIRAGQPDEQTVLVMLRGDLDVNEARLMHLLGVDALEPATGDAIRARIGAEPGYASPIGIHVRTGDGTDGALVIADESLRTMGNFVTGANEPGYHVINANYPRDFAVTCMVDIAQPFDGATCARCGGVLHTEQATELSRFEKPVTQDNRCGATYLDPDGKPQPVRMGHCRVALDNLLAAVIETQHDDYGIIWPPAVAPFDVHLVALAREESTTQIADRLYTDLVSAGLEVLYDDRNLSPGVMFADADLIGVPLRVTVSTRSLESGGIEIRWRHEKDRHIIPLEGAVSHVVALISGLDSPADSAI